MKEGYLFSLDGIKKVERSLGTKDSFKELKIGSGGGERQGNK